MKSHIEGTDLNKDSLNKDYDNIHLIKRIKVKV